MLRLLQRRHFVRTSAPLLRVPAATPSTTTPTLKSSSFSTSRPLQEQSTGSSLEEWTRTIRAQKTVFHDTADLNKARQLLLVLPDIAGASSPVTSSRDLLPKHTSEDALALGPGSHMPLGSELVLNNPLLTETLLGYDGTERTFGPPGGLDQRMWASGSFELEHGRQLRVGQNVECEVSVESVTPKQGAKTGLMVLVTRKLEYRTKEQGTVMTERRTHVYRKQRPADQRRYVPPSTDIQTDLKVAEEKPSDFGFDYYATRAALFRYSAATFNAHRIHLDPEYCRSEEGHPDCLVHGPLTATLLLNLVSAAAKDVGGDVKKFEYRATSPLTVEQTVRLRGAWDGSDKRRALLWALNEAGNVCMSGSAYLY